MVVELAQLERLRSELLDQVDLPAHLVEVLQHHIEMTLVVRVDVLKLVLVQ